MNTSNATILPSSVGQLAKSGNILLKPSNNEALTVGRHSNRAVSDQQGKGVSFVLPLLVGCKPNFAALFIVWYGRLFTLVAFGYA